MAKAIKVKETSYDEAKKALEQAKITHSWDTHPNAHNMNNEQTLHLFVTDKCENNCPLCCNKDYPVETIPVATVDDIKQSSIVCITGGEPFSYRCQRKTFSLIIRLRRQYRNIRKLYVYSSGSYFGNEFAHNKRHVIIPPRLLGNSGIDGISWGPKSLEDWKGLILFEQAYRNVYPFTWSNKDPQFEPLSIDEWREPECDNRVPVENRLYVFPEWEEYFNKLLQENPEFAENLHATVIHKEWQQNFKPAENSIFRRLPILLC